MTSPAITNPLPPWVRGIADNLAAAKLLLDSVLESRNRLALILLDSALEIGFREYLENVKKITGLDDDAMKHRENLIKVVGRNSKITEDDWTQIDFFYDGPDGWTLSDAGRDRFFEIFDRATRET